ncbi:MAG: gamma-glutamyl-phosphate reductase, partial [Candidatus Omnitrophica bacterium CG23_combo_of_CG06-09_8_20_14_all_41_10]
MDLKQQITHIAKNAANASRVLANLAASEKNKILKEMAESLNKNKEAILNANKKDIVLAKKKRLSAALIDRLTLDEKRITDMADCLLSVAKLDDAAGVEIKSWVVPSGLKIHKVRVPIG